jgi:hypothetical protein
MSDSARFDRAVEAYRVAVVDLAIGEATDVIRVLCRAIRDREPVNFAGVLVPEWARRLLEYELTRVPGVSCVCPPAAAAPHPVCPVHGGPPPGDYADFPTAPLALWLTTP